MSTTAANTYSGIANTLKDRILLLIPDHPAILVLESAWDLFKIEGFECSDLGPSMAQAQWALGRARQEWRKSTPDPLAGALDATDGDLDQLEPNS